MLLSVQLRSAVASWNDPQVVGGRQKAPSSPSMLVSPGVERLYGRRLLSMAAQVVEGPSSKKQNVPVISPSNSKGMHRVAATHWLSASHGKHGSTEPRRTFVHAPVD
jgi:hypothetical protein